MHRQTDRQLINVADDNRKYKYEPSLSYIKTENIIVDRLNKIQY